MAKRKNERYVVTFAQGDRDARLAPHAAQMVMEIPFEIGHNFPPKLHKGDTMVINGFDHMIVSFVRRTRRDDVVRIFLRLEAATNG